MGSFNRRTLRCLSQALLVYLLGLHLVGAPLHRHPDATPGEDGVTAITAADGCQLCDWLAQPALTLADVCFVEDVFRLPGLLNAVSTSPRIAGWAGFSGDSRAPPLV